MFHWNASACQSVSLTSRSLTRSSVRSSFVAGYYGAPMMVAQRKGLIVFTSASGAVHYVFGPVYGAHKSGMDKQYPLIIR
ncbi:MAG TPA: hypothetical protein VNO35_27615 [Steroidobacteraceae bacterium]|nr:hypothetical protein [Steroidobacteraceae bacterium]